MRRLVAAAVVTALVATVLALAACGSNKAETTQPTTQATDTATTIGTRTFTLEDLAEFDGKDGRPAYIAVDGVVYDVSASSKWPEGEHTVCNLGSMAGQDLSEAITQAPTRMRSNLERMPVVGTLE
jgi:predicted heme/steroid binding protein